MQEFLDQIRTYLQEGCSEEEAKQLAHSPLLKEHELASAGYALLAHRLGLPPVDLALMQNQSGAVPLFRRGFFLWRGLPYPTEHAELGSCLAQLPSYREIAEKMLPFQNATLDHDKQPILSFFSQCASPRQEKASETFFQALEKTPSEDHTFLDEELGILMERDGERTVLCTGSGCKSGMGAYLYRDSGVVNYGPQMTPVGESAGFGLSGRAQNLSCSEKRLTYRTSLSAPHPRDTGLPHLCDSGYCGAWIKASVSFTEKGVRTACEIMGNHSHASMRFVVFGKGSSCLIAGSHKLNPRSLDRYQGPAQTLEFIGEEGGVHINAMHGLSALEVIPLAGDASFWGADFLAAYTLATPAFGFEIKHFSA